MTRYRFPELVMSALLLLGIFLACGSSSAMAQPLARPLDLAGEV